jgi:hypothetical protein
MGEAGGASSGKTAHKNDALPGIIPLAVKETVTGKVESSEAPEPIDFYALFIFSLFFGFRSLRYLVGLGFAD